MSYSEIQERRLQKNHVQPVNDYRLGWLAFADGFPVEVCENEDMRRGWWQAIRDYANADVMEVYA